METTIYKKQKKRGLGWWKIYLPFIVVAFTLHCKFWYAEEDWVFKTLFPTDSKTVSGYFILLFFLILFVPFLIYRHKHPDRWKLPWYHPRNLGIGFIFSCFPAVFLANVYLVLLLWLNSRWCSATYEQVYRVEVVDINEKKHSTPMPYSGKGMINNYPYAKLSISGIEGASPYRTVYTSVRTGRSFTQMRGVRLVVKQKDGWLGYGVIESIVAYSCVSGHLISKKGKDMTNIQYIPAAFETVKLGNTETLENSCSPLYGKEITINSLYIHTPEKIILAKEDSAKCIIPLCIRYCVSLRRALKYSDTSQMDITIRRLQDDRVYSGEVRESGSEGELLFPDDDDKEAWLEKQAAAAKAQRYSDKELDEGQYSDDWMNINLLEYVDMPFLPGKYEIAASFYGLKSNRALVEIETQ